MIGQTVGSYQIKEQIGQGGMSLVYRAYHPATERHVALKIITKSLARDNDTIQRFQREARLVARLEHPHILPVYDFDSGYDPPYIVMRLLPGGSLKALQAQSHLNWEEIGAIISQVCEALQYAHRQGVIHRDIKPSNVLIDGEGHAFVADFGVARMVAAEKNVHDITSSGAMVGTPDYMSPEQAYGRDDIDHRADIYSLGVVLFELLTGQLPFTADSVVATIMKHIQQKPPLATAVNPALPPAVDEVILRALAKTAADRYHSAGELATDLLRALKVSGSHTAGLTQAAQTLLLTQSSATQVQITQTPTEQYKGLTVMHVNAAEYMEFLDAWPENSINQHITFWEQVEAILEADDCLIMSQTSNSLLAVWGAETVREADVAQATQAALAIQAALRTLIADIPLFESGQLPLNMAIHTGLALVSKEKTGKPAVRGAAISLANRLAQQAQGRVLLSQDAYNQVRGLFDIEADAPLRIYRRHTVSTMPTYRVLAAKAHQFSWQIQDVAGILTPTIGRDQELTQLQTIFAEVIEAQQSHFVTVTAVTGLGKSRLLNDFISWVDLHPQPVRLLPAQATPDMHNKPYALLRDLISFRFDIHQDDSPAQVAQKLADGIEAQVGRDDRMAHLLGYLAGFDLSSSPYIDNLAGDPQQLVFQARQVFYDWLTRLCAIDPLLIVVEDSHHADRVSLDLLAELMTWDDLPLFVICLARPLLYQERPFWGEEQPNHHRLMLSLLNRSESRQLITHLLPHVAHIPAALYDFLLEQAEGNPYYLEELIRMLLDERVIIKDNDRVWRVEIDRLNRLQIPTTLSWLLQARLDSLLQPEKISLQRAAVIGRIFHDTALTALGQADGILIDEQTAVLNQLQRRGFIQERETRSLSDSVEYMFNSNMLREVLLQTIPAPQKKLYNLAAANWLIQIGADRLDEHNNAISIYYERADYLADAAHYRLRAGENALRVSAFEGAKTLFTETLVLVSTDDASYAEIQLKLGETYYWLSDYQTAKAHLKQALASHQENKKQPYQARAFYWLSQIDVRQGQYGQAKQCLQKGLTIANATNDTQTIAQILFGLGDLHWREGKFSQAQINCAKSLSIAQALGHVALQLNALNRLGAIAMSLGHPSEAVAIYEQTYALAQESGNRIYAASALNNLGEVALTKGDLAAARAYYEQALPITQQANQLNFTAMLHTNLATVGLKSGDMVATRQHLAEALAISAEIKAAPAMLSVVQKMGWLLVVEGQRDRGLTLLGLVWHHPAADSENLRELQELFAEWGWQADDPEIVAAMAKGQQLDLITTVAQLQTKKGSLGIQGVDKP
jgi:serine/threonine protein kinase/tetratricopeptide (TPR) repeat protein